MSLRLPRKAALGALLTLSAVSAARPEAGSEPERLIMGSVMYPAKSWVVETRAAYDARRYGDESKDELRQTLDLEHAFSEAWTAELGVSAPPRRRTAFGYDAASATLRRLISLEPVQAAVSVEHKASLRGGPDEPSVAVELLRNRGDWSIQAEYEGEFRKERYGPRRFASQTHLGLFRRFGLQSLMGGGWAFDSFGGHEAHVHIASAVGPHAFFGLEPRLGLGRRAPDFGLDFVLSLYFGPSGMGEWLLR